MTITLCYVLFRAESILILIMYAFIQPKNSAQSTQLFKQLLGGGLYSLKSYLVLVGQLTQLTHSKFIEQWRNMAVSTHFSLHL